MARSHTLSRAAAPAAWRSLLLRPRLWGAALRQRRALLALDDHLLRDIGIPRHVAADEAARPFWDVPKGWKR